MVFILASIVDEHNLAIIGAYNTLADAKRVVDGLASAIYNGIYKNVTLYHVEMEKFKVYTFTIKDVTPAFQEQQRQIDAAHPSSDVPNTTTSQPQSNDVNANNLQPSIALTLDELQAIRERQLDRAKHGEIV